MDKFKLAESNSDYVILSDFDGTISIQDVNNAIFENFGDEQSEIIEEKLINNKISDREALERHYSRLTMNKKRFENFIENNINLDPYFNKFYENIKEKNIDFAIVSGGFLEYIKITLEKENINYKDKIYANQLVFDNDEVKPIFLHEIKKCDEIFGPCGNCKYKLLSQHPPNKKIIYIGDGLTDRCVAGTTDYLLVKKNSILEEYCKKNKIRHHIFTSFKEVNEIINDLLEQ